MIEMGKTYRTRDGREVRIYATDGEENKNDGPIHGAYRSIINGWLTTSWFSDGKFHLSCKDDLDLIECDPHGILPRHRELLWAVCNEIRDSWAPCGDLRYESFENIPTTMQAALIALARLDGEKGE